MAVTSRDLEVFAAVVDAGSFGRAARALMISQPSVSECIAKLESRLGAQLFLRTPRGVVATAAGEALIPFAQSQEDLLLDATAAVRSTADTPGLTVAIHSTFTARVAPLILGAIAGTPRRVELRDAHSDQVISLVADGAADAGVIAAGTTPRGIVGLRLPSDPICCAVAPTHPLASGRRCHVSDLDGYEVAYNRWGNGAEAFADLLSRYHHQPELRRTVADARTAGLLAVRHNHVAIVARSTIELELEERILHEIDVVDMPSWTIEIDFVYRTNSADAAVLSIAARAQT